MQRNQHYERPQIADLGSIAEHTYVAGNNPFGTVKGGGPIAHCDTWNEWSGGTGEDKGDCTGVVNPDR